MILNVTPQEFFEIKNAAQDLHLGEFEAWLLLRYPKCLHRLTMVVVRKDVPSIPWMSRGIERYEGGKG